MYRIIVKQCDCGCGLWSITLENSDGYTLYLHSFEATKEDAVEKAKKFKKLLQKVEVVS